MIKFVNFVCIMACATAMTAISLGGEPTTSSEVAKAAKAVVAAQAEIEKSVFDNKTEEIEKHAQAARAAAVRAAKASAAEDPAIREAVSRAATVVEKTASELVKVGKDGTIAEHGILIEQLKEQAATLTKAAGGAGVTDITAIGNKRCPISGHPVGSMQKGSHIVYKTHKVGLCCDACIAKFKSSPEVFLKKAQSESSNK